MFPAEKPELLFEFRKLLREARAVDEFIDEHLEGVPHHVERAGKAKGEPLAFPRKKTHAALLHLKLGGELRDLEELARKTGISYSLLGKWRTEKRFQEAVKKYEAEFGMLVTAFVLAYIGDCYENTVPDVDLALKVIPELKDVVRWSPKIRRAIYLALHLHPEQLEQRKLPVVDRFVAGLFGVAIYGELFGGTELREAYSLVGKQLKGLIATVTTRIEASIQKGDQVQALQDTELLKALIYPLVSPEIWPV